MSLIAVANTQSVKVARQELAIIAENAHEDYKAALRRWNIAEENYREFCSEHRAALAAAEQ